MPGQSSIHVVGPVIVSDGLVFAARRSSERSAAQRSAAQATLPPCHEFWDTSVLRVAPAGLPGAHDAPDGQPRQDCDRRDGRSNRRDRGEGPDRSNRQRRAHAVYREHRREHRVLRADREGRALGAAGESGRRGTMVAVRTAPESPRERWDEKATLVGRTVGGKGPALVSATCTPWARPPCRDHGHRPERRIQRWRATRQVQECRIQGRGCCLQLVGSSTPVVEAARRPASG